MPHGRSFQVLDRDAFTNRALPRYFGHSEFYLQFIKMFSIDS
jgi:hypothetical protein